MVSQQSLPLQNSSAASLGTRVAFSDTEDECLDNTTHSQQDTQQDVNNNDYPSRQSKSKLNLTRNDSGLLVHANHAKSIYVYNQSEKSTARKNKAFQDLIARDPNFECSINWAAGKTAKVWVNFVEGIDCSPHDRKARVACRKCGAIMIHPHNAKGSKGNLAGLWAHYKRCSRQSAIQTLDDFADAGYRRAKDKIYTRQRLQEAQLAFAVEQNIPFLTFESTAWKELIAIIKLAPHANDLLNRKALATHLHRCADEQRQKLAVELAGNKQVARIYLTRWMDVA